MTNPFAPAPYRVLIVEDNAVNQQVFQMILDAGGFAHVTASNGREGLEAARTGDFDLVLMDIQMPVMDGLEATGAIRGWERDAGRLPMPIYIVSANCLQEHVDAGTIAGADGHFSKPVAVGLLLSTIQGHAEATRALAA